MICLKIKNLCTLAGSSWRNRTKA